MKNLGNVALKACQDLFSQQLTVGLQCGDRTIGTVHLDMVVRGSWFVKTHSGDGCSFIISGRRQSAMMTPAKQG